MEREAGDLGLPSVHRFASGANLGGTLLLPPPSANAARVSGSQYAPLSQACQPVGVGGGAWSACRRFEDKSGTHPSPRSYRRQPVPSRCDKAGAWREGSKGTSSASGSGEAGSGPALCLAPSDLQDGTRCSVHPDESRREAKAVVEAVGVGSRGEGLNSAGLEEGRQPRPPRRRRRRKEREKRLDCLHEAEELLAEMLEIMGCSQAGGASSFEGEVSGLRPYCQCLSPA